MKTWEAWCMKIWKIKIILWKKNVLKRIRIICRYFVDLNAHIGPDSNTDMTNWWSLLWKQMSVLVFKMKLLVEMSSIFGILIHFICGNSVLFYSSGPILNGLVCTFLSVFCFKKTLRLVKLILLFFIQIWYAYGSLEVY